MFFEIWKNEKYVFSNTVHSSNDKRSATTYTLNSATLAKTMKTTPVCIAISCAITL